MARMRVLIGVAGRGVLRRHNGERGKSEVIYWLESEKSQGDRVKYDDHK